MPTTRTGQPAPDALLDAEVFERGGHRTTLRPLIAGRPSVLVFLRHFGCIGCDRHVTELTPRFAELDSVGVVTVLVGNGESRYLEGFIERYRLGDRAVVLVTDPSRATFAAAGLKRSWWSTFGPRAVWAALTSFGQGYRQRSIHGDALQQGGALVLDADARVVLHHVSEALGDNLSGNDIVAAALGVVMRGCRQADGVGLV